MIARALRLLHTLRYLRPVQFYGRLWFRFYRPRPDLRPSPSRRSTVGQWQACAQRKPSLSAKTRFHMLNDDVDLIDVGGWQAPQLSYLLRYNLHYFDDLNAAKSADRKDWHVALVERWVEENPPAQGVGWEPYPTSLRIVNWLKWTLAGNSLSPSAEHSLAIQTRHLRKRLEHHLLGNHLFSNAKALIFAGCYFDGVEAQAWLAAGLKIIERELDEQILGDGGQFERSPMYHALAFEDLLDLLNLARSFPGCVESRLAADWEAVAARMWRWLRVMCHPDGEVSHFNDSVSGVAPEPAQLEAYAQRLGLAQPTALRELERLTDSGYIRLQRGAAVLLIDVAPIGPDYLPGHAHADTLSFELSVRGERLLVNSGIDRYGVDAERLRQRGTAAHNTVTVDELDSSEVWSGFRVARRARPVHLQVAQTADLLSVQCAHDGYLRLPGRVVHRRFWRLRDDGLEVEDRIEGECQGAMAHYHFAPSVEPVANNRLTMRCGIGVDLSHGLGHSEWIETTYHPQFEISYPARKLTIAAEPGTSEIALSLRW